ncbi:hypothetical protein [Cyanothece sp. BG0011]|uniref:hypothetical protein n=1 Tax=Cyanothece sp. BG0011 TaxID=2082950 RepID=UPI0018E4DE42|nr:hypothetical protein [Cyanothece sp. BG0011]
MKRIAQKPVSLMMISPNYGEKPKGYKFSGKRFKRGLYKTAKGWLVNADIQQQQIC